jgi:glycosyltransferase involved in cell wall biosynthesis
MDFDSFPSRKNPQGVLDVFAAAFPSNQFNDVELLLKVRGTNDKGSRELIQGYAARDKRIKIIDQTLGRNEMDALINASNVYLSMHRSEGFGFGPAEALASEKIVVSTDYSGTCDFINSDTGYPISYRLVPVKPVEYPHWENQLWADPFIESAAQSLRDIYDHYEDAQERAKNGRKLMIQQHSFAAVGKVISSLF